MIDALVFSRDRPAQLDLLLQSVRRFAPAGIFATLTVLYTHAREYALGYQYARQDHPWARFQPEHDFDLQVRRWLQDAGPFVGFLCDDDVFFRTVPRPQFLPWSYRCGDYDYPFSLDGCVYQRGRLQAAFRVGHFADPTQLEAGVDAAWPYERGFQGHYCCLVGIPANRVSPSSGMPHMGIDPLELNWRYIGGERIDLDGMDFSKVARAHETIPYVWRPR